MSAIARLMQARGYTITGDDRADSPMLKALRAEGIVCHIGHAAENLGAAEAVAPSSAIPPDAPALLAARARGLPIWHRGDLLNALIGESAGICIAGTHGKTTTTDMVAKILLDAGQDPSYIVGGNSSVLPSNAHAGSGSAFVLEADEYDRTFCRLFPTVAVITNCEFDHPDTYATYADTQTAFAQFASQVKPGGALISCAEDAGASALAQGLRDQARTDIEFVDYGIHHGGWRALNLRANPFGGFDYRLRTLDGRVTEVSLRVSGHHNVLNSLAALAVADSVGVPLNDAAESLGIYQGAARRFEYKGEKRGVRFFDDYAHNPAKIRAALSGARFRFPVGNIWAVWQPHTYSRTLALMPEFARSFVDADHVLVLPVFAARERLEDFGKDADRVNTISVAREVMKHHRSVRPLGGIGDAVGLLYSLMRPGDIIISLSAGDGNQVIDKLVAMA